MTEVICEHKEADLACEEGTVKVISLFFAASVLNFIPWIWKHLNQLEHNLSTWESTTNHLCWERMNASSY